MLQASRSLTPCQSLNPTGYFRAALHTPSLAPTRIPERHQQRKGPFPRRSSSRDGQASHWHPDATAAGGLWGSSVLSHQTHPSSTARGGDASAQFYTSALSGLFFVWKRVPFLVAEGTWSFLFPHLSISA